MNANQQQSPGLLGRLGFLAGRLLVGPVFTRALQEMQAAQWLSPAELHRRTEAHLAVLLHHAAEQVPYYRQVYRDLGLSADALGRLDDLRQLPVVDKATYREGPAEMFLAEDTGPHRRLEYTTSGSTGEPLRFFLDRKCGPLVYASHMYYDSCFGLKPFDRFVRFMAPPAQEPDISSEAPASFRLRQGVSRRLQALHERLTQRRFSMFDVDPSRIEEIHEVLVRFKPAYLMGYTSSLATLADEMKQRNLAIARPLKGVITIAETLTPERRRLINEVFPAPIINRYGQREFKYWAAQSCHEDDQRFHVNTELVAAEVLRDDGTPAEPDEVGRLVLTNLHNHVMPFIRYDTSDRAALSAEPCACGRGFPLISRLEGRSQEVLTTPAGKMVNPVGLGQYLFVTLDYIRSVKHYQLVQEAADQVVLRVVPIQEWSEPLRASLQQDMEELLGSDVTVRIESVAAIPLERSGKRPVIKVLESSTTNGS